MPVSDLIKDTDKILNYSHISYNAMGGFTGVESYGVLITCIESRVSVLKTIRDPKRLGAEPLREVQNMSAGAYLALWRNLARQNVMAVASAPEPQNDLMDEFTFYFEAQVADQTNRFSIYGVSQPHGARYLALKNLLDQATGMAALWSRHQAIAQK